MTQTSYFWDGLVTGDASLSRYDRNELAAAFSSAFGSDYANGFVVPRVGGNLAVTETGPASAGVSVAAGEAWVKGWRYVSDAAETLAIAPNASGNPRIDRVVLRISWVAQTVRLAVIQGADAAVPALPGFTQVYGTTWEIPLAYIWVANGFATIGDEDIHEERVFLSTALEMAFAIGQQNLIVNSEFMAFGHLSNGAITRKIPDYWKAVGGGATNVAATRPAQMSRGRAWQTTAAVAGDGMEQLFPVKASTQYAIKVLTYVTAGDVGQVVVTTDSAAPGTVTRNVRRTGAWIEETILYTTEADATLMSVRLLAVTAGDIIQYGQCIAQEGFVPGPFRQFHELLIFDNPVTDASWDGDAKSDGSTTVELAVSFGGYILEGTRSLYVQVKARDSGSGAGACSIAVSNINTRSLVTLWLQGVPNDIYREVFGFVMLQPETGFFRRIQIAVDATGAATLDATVQICGIGT